MKIRSTIAAVALAAVAVPASGATAPPPGRGVAFTQLRGDALSLVVGGQAAITALPASNGQRPSWSPDGSRVAFVCGDFSICVAQAGRVREVTTGNWPARWTYDGDPAWSPDGRRLAFDSNRGGAYRIYTVGDAGGTPHAVLGGRLPDQARPAWSPNGKEIAFDARSGKGRSIYIVAVDGRSLRRLTPAGVNAQSPSWSPDGRSVAYTRVTKRGSGIDVISAAGGRPRTIVPATRRNDHPAWSPAGTTIAFDTNRAGPVGIWTVPAGGGTPTLADAGRAGPDLFPTWRPEAAPPAGSIAPPAPRTVDGGLVSTYIASSLRVGADVFALHADAAPAIRALVRDAAAARTALRRPKPPDSRGRRFQRAALDAFAAAAAAGRSYTAMVAALQSGERTTAFGHAKAALLRLAEFGRKVNAANAIAGLD
jgi:dipeptidyl aminopeptidase/acylaminoacyl peptidase